MSKKTKSSKTPATPKTSAPAKKRGKASTTPPETPGAEAVAAPIETSVAPARETPQTAPEVAPDANVGDVVASTPDGATSGEAPAKPTKTRKPKEPKVKQPSGLDAAAQVLAEAGVPMTCKAIVEQMLAKGLWKTEGKTPAATIYSAILREIDGKPADSRFVKTGRGLFGLTKKQ